MMVSGQLTHTSTIYQIPEGLGRWKEIVIVFFCLRLDLSRGPQGSPLTSLTNSPHPWVQKKVFY